MQNEGNMNQKYKFKEDEAFALRMDEGDPMSHLRDRFYVPEDGIYMDGNSLGLMPKSSEAAITRIMEEWKTLGIDGWLKGETPWFYFSERLGAQCASLVGASADEVVCTGTTTVNIHSLISSLYLPKGKRTKILADELNFPSDIYALKGQIKLKGLKVEDNLILAPSRDGKTLKEEDIVDLMDESIAVALLPSVLYRSGQLLDIPLLTKKAHEKGIIIGFDCSHSVGAVPHYFDDWDVDFALWCSYKYLNSGPGSPSFLYLNKTHFNKESFLAGWFGNKKETQFDMLLDFQQEKSAAGWQISSPMIFGASAIEGSLKIFNEIGIERIRDRSLKLTSYLIHLIEEVLAPSPYDFKIGTPQDPDKRSGHIALERDPGAWQVCQALKSRNITPDFRPPNIIRLAPIALYNSFHEVWRTVHHIQDIIDKKAHLEFQDQRSAIT
jgi:kynureninase